MTDAGARHVVVIGGGPAGTLAAIAAKRQDAAANVVLLTEERCEPYEKPPLSKAVLTGTQSPVDTRIAGPGGVAGHGVILETRARCTAIDRTGRVVFLEDGRRVPYDALVVATGSVVREISELRRGMPSVHYLRTEADACLLRAELRQRREVLVVGGGLIGLEVAASAAELGVKPTVLEAAPRILARVCDEETGALVHAAHRRRGVDIRVNTAVVDASLRPDGRIATTTNTGDLFVADLVVVGVGTRPRHQIAAEAGLATDDGLIVDEHCRTSDSAIFAAGDLVRFPGPHGLVRLENWQHAQDQGVVAGRNAAGGNDVYKAVPSFWSEQYDLHIQGVGWGFCGGERVHRLVEGRSLFVFELCDDRITHAIGVNVRREMAVARRLIERRVLVDPVALADRSRPLSGMLKRAQDGR